MKHNNIQEVVATLTLMALAMFLGTIIAWLIIIWAKSQCLKKLNEYENIKSPIQSMTQEMWLKGK